MKIKTELSENELVDWLLFVIDKQWTAIEKKILLEHYVCATEIYSHCHLDSFLDFINENEYGREYKNKFKKKYATPRLSQHKNYLEQHLSWLSQPLNHLICYNDELYPNELKQLTDPPVALFASGRLDCLSNIKIAIVGSRKPSPAGYKLTQQLGEGLAKVGISIVSGMALGVDGIAHRACLNVEMQTISVMGCGLDVVYPRQHQSLFQEIKQKGLLLSEYPLGSQPNKFRFPQRNRIVSGLSHGVIIVEAAHKSGTMITARLAMEQNRELMVVPGSPINPQYEGSLRLIQQGAACIVKTEDVLNLMAQHFNDLLEFMNQKKSANNNGDINSNGDVNRAKMLPVDEELFDKYPLLALIGYEPETIEQIIQKSKMEANQVSSELIVLEIHGLIAKTDAGYMRV